MKKLLQKLYLHQFLSMAEAHQSLIDITQQVHNPAEIAAFLSIFNMRPIHLDELKGFKDAMLELCQRVNLNDYHPIDVCGTGGDGKNSFNISTLSAFVLAGAGIPVAKHGNYGVSSISGSSNIMEYYGVQYQTKEDGLKRQLDKANICFLHAPLFHPGMKSVAPIRKQLGIKTFFNMLGPLCNPSQPKVQMIGVYDLSLLRLFQYILQDEKKQFSLVHSIDGYDEVSLTGDFKQVTHLGEQYSSRNDYTTLAIEASDLFGGNNLDEAAKIFMTVLYGKGTLAQQEIVLVNSAIAYQTYYPHTSFDLAKEKVSESLLNQKASKQFELLKSVL